jgi:aspartyl-tRNA(Asn)/glutamyl-tRNA(Gln) amidotransferase subunit B
MTQDAFTPTLKPPALIRGYEVVIGIETHAQLSTASKIFSASSSTFGATPNTQASALDLALPGTLPVLNRGAVERAIGFGLAVHATVAPRSIFARKNYFYPDLPKGYQISQYEIPVVQGGHVDIHVPAAGPFAGGVKRIHLTRAHLEEDAGKSMHEGMPAHPTLGHAQSGIDLNRAGTPLLEIVSEPEMRSSAEAVAYAKALHTLVVWLGLCDGNMQEGSFRCDADLGRRLVRAARSRTSIRFASCSKQSTWKCNGRSTRLKTGWRSSKPRCSSTLMPRAGVAKRARCAAKKMRMTTATFQTPTCRP